MFKFYYLIPLLLVLAFSCPSLGERLWAGFYGWFYRRFEHCSRRGALFVGLLAVILISLAAFYTGIPTPKVSDEFGNLLNADTFVQGRLSNPAHSMWQHFESIHIIHQPTYISKYPPGQGFVLAIGQLLWKPVLGVWLSSVAACVAVYWMLLAWLPRRWALLGGLLAVLHPQIIAWNQNYWGGAVAVIGGSLVTGALRRIVDKLRTQDALLMGLGMIILANTRPYEGFVLALLMGGSLIAWLLGPKGPPLAQGFRRILLPLGGVLFLGALQIGYYNKATTGHFLKMPYTVHEETYGATPLFLWQTPTTPPQYRHKEIHDLQAVQYRGFFEAQRNSSGILQAIGSKLFSLGQGYLWSGLFLIPLLGLPAALRRDRWTVFALATVVLFTLAMLLGTWVFTHYAAPVFDLFLVLVLQSMRQLNRWKWRGKPSGAFLVRSSLFLCLVSVGIVVLRLKQNDPAQWNLRRQAILEEFTTLPGKHLIFIRYAADHNPNREWVYNPADLDEAKVLLARIMSPEEDRKLREYFKDRQFWVINADDPQARPVRLSP